MERIKGTARVQMLNGKANGQSESNSKGPSMVLWSRTCSRPNTSMSAGFLATNLIIRGHFSQAVHVHRLIGVMLLLYSANIVTTHVADFFLFFERAPTMPLIFLYFISYTSSLPIK